MDNVENTVEEVELTAAEKLAQFEKEKLSRRQALARFGFQAGAAAIAALTADELLRKVGKEMQRRAGDNKVAQQVAREFQQAGVANALAIVPDPHVGAGNIPGGCNVDVPPANREQCCDGAVVGMWCGGGYSTVGYCEACCGGTYRNWCALWNDLPGVNYQTCMDKCTGAS